MIDLDQITARVRKACPKAHGVDIIARVPFDGTPSYAVAVYTLPGLGISATAANVDDAVGAAIDQAHKAAKGGE